MIKIVKDDDFIPLFRIGEVFATPKIMEKMDIKEVEEYIKRHVQGDFGDIAEEDKKANMEAIESHDSNIISGYRTQEEEIFFIITEADRSATTVLMEGEY